MNVDYTKTYKLNSTFKADFKDEKILYFDYQNANWFRTNLTGHRILTACTGQSNMDKVMSEMASEQNFDHVVLKKLFDNFLSDAIENGILYEYEETENLIMESIVNTYPFISNTISDLWIHLSDKCNLNCPFCYSNSGADNNYTLDHEKIVAFLEQIDKNNRNSIILSGGEPFLYKNLIQLVKSIREMSFKSILIITNGTVGEEMYKEAIQYVDGIQVSVDGTVADIHDVSRGTGSYAKMIKNLKLLKQYGVKKLIISFTPTTNNIQDLPNVPKFAYHNNINAIHITRLMPVGRGKALENTLSLDSSIYQDNFKLFVDNFSNIEKVISIDSELEKSKRDLISLTFAGDQSYKVAYKQRKMTCGMGMGSMCVGYDGKIYPCSSMQYDIFSFGTIEDSLNKVIENAKKFMKNNSVDNIPECKNCKFRYMCGGGCRACAYSYSGCENIHAPDPLCERYKKEIYELAWILSKPRVNKSDISENPLGYIQ
jgi:radical SAM protein with 4Fe4S-binding SPASM domain